MSLLRPERRNANLNGLSQILQAVGRSPRSTAGVTVTSDSAKRMMAVWRCQHLLADLVSGLPVDQFRKEGDRRVEVTASEFVRAPSNLVDGNEWRYQMMLSALDCGNAYALVTEWDGSYRYARKAEVLAPSDVLVRQAGALAAPSYHVGGKDVTGRVLHLRAFGPMPGSVLGMSPIEYAAQTVGVGLASKQYGAGWYEGGGHPTTALVSEQTLDKTDADTAKQRFKDATRDDHVVALGKGWKVQTLQVNPKDALFLDSINATAVEVCGYYGIPPELLGYASGGSSVTYANREQRALDLLVFTVQWWIGRIERLISAQTPAPQFVKLNLDALLRSDLLTRYQAHDMRIRGGWGTPNEARTLEDLEPLPAGYGDEPLWPPYSTTADTEPEEGDR